MKPSSKRLLAINAMFQQQLMQQCYSNKDIKLKLTLEINIQKQY